MNNFKINGHSKNIYYFAGRFMGVVNIVKVIREIYLHKIYFFFSFLKWGETESTWYVGL
jgi:hypothetical protein